MNFGTGDQNLILEQITFLEKVQLVLEYQLFNVNSSQVFAYIFWRRSISSYFEVTKMHYSKSRGVVFSLAV